MQEQPGKTTDQERILAASLFMADLHDQIALFKGGTTDLPIVQISCTAMQEFLVQWGVVLHTASMLPVKRDQ